MIDKFENYLTLGKVKRKTPDAVEARSLLDKAEKRLKYIRRLNDDTSNLVLEDAYEAAREAAQALMSLKGFKPYSHEATISFVRDYYKKYFTEYDIAQFNRFRELRSNSIYRAETINIDDAQKCTEFANNLTRTVSKIIKIEK